MLTGAGVPETLARDYAAIRKTKRSPLTATALAGLQREAAKAGLTLAQAVQYAAEQGWAGFRAQWLHNAQQPHGRTDGFVPTAREVKPMEVGGVVDMRTGQVVAPPEFDEEDIDF